MDKAQKIAAYDPSDLGLDNGNLFGLPFTTEESEVIVLPMPWEVTVSYRDGTAAGPETMFECSQQVDLYDPDIVDAWKMGISMEPIPAEWQKKNDELRKKAEHCIDHLVQGGHPTDALVAPLYAEINAAGEALNKYIYERSSFFLDQGKAVCVAGGEHSVSQGLIQALSERHEKFSILHIDAHADLRQAYEGFEYSHASIMYNAQKLSQVDQMVLVGIRDFSEQEANRMKDSGGRLLPFEDRTLKRRSYRGETWEQICRDIVKPLSDKVYISFDIDALDPSLCPHTGTPVPGGLEFEQVFFMIEMLLEQNKTIIGFDLCEVAPGVSDDWDSIVGVRALYRLANLMAVSQGRKG